MVKPVESWGLFWNKRFSWCFLHSQKGCWVISLGKKLEPDESFLSFYWTSTWRKHRPSWKFSRQWGFLSAADGGFRSTPNQGRHVGTQVEDIGFFFGFRGKVTISLGWDFPNKSLSFESTPCHHCGHVFDFNVWKTNSYCWGPMISNCFYMDIWKISYQKGTVYIYFPKKWRGQSKTGMFRTMETGWELDVQGFLKITQRIWGILLHG